MIIYKKIKFGKKLIIYNFNDLPLTHSFVKPIQYRNKETTIPFRKRIQVAVYNVDIISNFTLYKTIQIY